MKQIYSPSARRYIEVEALDQESSAPPVKSSKINKQTGKDFLHVDMCEVVRGCNVTSIVWLRLLQLKTIRKQNTLVLANEWFERHGVDGWAKNRALRTLEQDGLIRVLRSDHRSPRVTIVPKKKRLRKSKKIAGQKCTGARTKVHG